MVKDIQDSFRYYYWNKESELQSGIKREEAVGCTDYEIYGEERGRRYRDVDESLVQAGKVYRAEESYSTVDGIVHDTIAVKSIIKWKEKKKWLLVTRWDITRLKTYERELIAAKEELEKALNKQKLALKSVNFGLIYIDKKLSGTMGRNNANCQPRERKALYTGTNLLQNKCTPGYSMRTMRLSESD